MKCSLLLLATILQAQPIKPDTRALAAQLKAAQTEQKGFPQFHAIQKSFLAWVDARLRAPLPLDALDRELKRAKLSGPGRDEFWGTDNVGLLEISAAPLPTAPDLLAVRLGVGVANGYDETIVFYQREARRRIGWLNGELSTGDSSLFSSFVVSEKDAGGKRLIVSSAYPILHRYEGPFTLKLRIDALEASSLKPILSKEEEAEYNYQPGKDTPQDLFANASVEGPIATFRFTRRMRNEQYEPAILRYRVTGDVATQIAPLAITRSGFIDEWVRLAPADAAKWSTPEALAGHNKITEFFNRHKDDRNFYLDKISLCKDSPRTWQISASSAFNAPTGTWYFILSESGAENMRMLSVNREAQQGCVEYDLGALTEELEPA